MPRTLNLYTSDTDLSNVEGNAGLLFECAPDSQFLANAECWFSPEEMLGSADAALHLVYGLVSKVLENTPVVEGCPLLSVFEETLLEQGSYIARAYHLDRWIAENGFTSCRFAAYSPWLDRLRQVQAVTRSEYVIEANLPPLQSSRLGRVVAKVWGLRGSPSELLRRIAPLWSRHLSAVWQRRLRASAPEGGAWFYSTSYNYTRIALTYEPYFPE